MKSSGWRSELDPELGFSFFVIETLAIIGQKVSQYLKNSSNRLRKGQLRRL